jgi:hypothetical protein
MTQRTTIYLREDIAEDFARANTVEHGTLKEKFVVSNK